jgi:hypothetical protein
VVSEAHVLARHRLGVYRKVGTQARHELAAAIVDDRGEEPLAATLTVVRHTPQQSEHQGGTLM